MSHVFLSYAREDRAEAESVAAALRARGWTLWLDTGMNAGAYWDEDIERALRAAFCVVVLWSKASVQSHWVRTEAEEARSRQILVPARLDDSELPYGFKRVQTADLAGWRDGEPHEGFEELVRGIGNVASPLQTPGVATPAPEPRRFRKAVLAGIAGAVPLLVVLAAATIPLPRTEITLDINASGLTFLSSRAQEVSDLLVVSQLGGAGFGRLRVPRSEGRADSMAIDAGVSVLQLVPADSRDTGAITLAPLLLTAGARTTYRKLEGPFHYRLSFEGEKVPVTVNLQRRVRILLAGNPAEILEFAAPRPLTMDSGGKGMEVDITLPSLVENVLPAAVAVNGLSLTRIDERSAAEGTSVREVSTVLAGTLRLDSVPGRSRQLGPGERIELLKPTGKIRELRLDRDSLSVNFHGLVQRLSVCLHETCVDITPRWAEWFWTQYRLACVFAALVYGLVMAWIAGRHLRLRGSGS